MVEKQWRKVLYEDQGVPDNFVAESFLTEMKKNLYIRTYNYKGLVLDTGRITQQIASVVLFVLCFVLLEQEKLSPLQLCGTSLCVTFFIYTLMKIHSMLNPFLDISSGIVFCVASYALAPILMTLTDTISTDTIYAMTTIMLLLHLLLHDYTHQASKVPGVVSFNAGVFATVCLASRLHTVAQAFSLLAFSLQIFSLWPSIRTQFRIHCWMAVDIIFTAVLITTTLVILYELHISLTILVAMLFVFITFICPYLLLQLQPLKNTIHGPWDEAVVHK